MVGGVFYCGIDFFFLFLFVPKCPISAYQTINHQLWGCTHEYDYVNGIRGSLEHVTVNVIKKFWLVVNLYI